MYISTRSAAQKLHSEYRPRQNSGATSDLLQILERHLINNISFTVHCLSILNYRQTFSGIF